ncbi:MAG: polysaccharide export outer membrane protein [Arcticibacterium sp.]|jgi:polysaccharide export outer membrane protein
MIIKSTNKMYLTANQKWKSFIAILIMAFMSSCATKKDIILFQDLEENVSKEVVYAVRKIQINDIIDVKISTLNPETAAPYNAGGGSANINANIELMKLQGYLVPVDGTISLPILGDIVVTNKTIIEIQNDIQKTLEEDGHLLNPTVVVRVLNAKVTILGEVASPGTYSYTEQFITLPQALGYAGDVTIGANRKEIWLIREEEGARQYYKIDLTKTDWFDTPAYTIKQNDIIYVYPNEVKVKSAGYIGNTGTVLSVISILFTTYALLIR